MAKRITLNFPRTINILECGCLVVEKWGCTVLWTLDQQEYNFTGSNPISGKICSNALAIFPLNDSIVPESCRSIIRKLSENDDESEKKQNDENEKKTKWRKRKWTETET